MKSREEISSKMGRGHDQRLCMDLDSRSQRNTQKKSSFNYLVVYCIYYSKSYRFDLLYVYCSWCTDFLWFF